ncbi:MAG: ribonuclease P protein component [Bacillota bacterium]
MRQEHRLRQRSEVRKVYTQGRAWKNRVAALYVLPSSDGPSQVAFAVSRRVGKAVKRNLVKRRLREAYRRYQEQVQPGLKLLFVARVQAGSATFLELEEGVTELLRRSGVVR